MIRTLTTLFRGRAHDAALAMADRNALPLLRQQIRDSAQAVDVSRRAVAVAMAQNEQETAQHDRLVSQISDLEARAVAALGQGKENLAQDAAAAIAHLEAERDVSAEAQARFSSEITRLRAVLRGAETRLRQLTRGQRLAVATDKTQRLQARLPDAGVSSLQEAEATLARLQARQAEIDATARAMTELEASDNAEAVAGKLAAAGCGAPLQSSADDVLARLRAKAEKKKTK